MVTEKNALLWTDSRYWSQAENELDVRPKNTFTGIKKNLDESDDFWTLIKQGEPQEPELFKWIKSNCQKGDKIGRSSYLLGSYRC